MIFNEPTKFSYKTFSLNTNSSINTIITETTWLILTSHFKINQANYGKYLTEATWLISISHFKSNHSIWGKDLTEAIWLISISHFKSNHAHWGKNLPNMIFTEPNNILQHNFPVEYQLKHQHDYNRGNMTCLNKLF